MTIDTFSNLSKNTLKVISFQRVFFIFFLLSLPLSIRKVLVIFSSDGVFNEYMDFSIYLSDIFLALTLLFFILEYKLSLLSIEYWRTMFHVEHLLLPIFIPSFFIVWSGLSIFWSESMFLASSAFLRLIEGYFLYIYILLSNVPRGTMMPKTVKCSTWNNFNSQSITQRDQEMFHVEQFQFSINNSERSRNVPRGTIFANIINFLNKCSTWNILQVIFTLIIISAVFQSFIAIFQFIWQKSLSLNFLGESIFSVSDTGVAKIVINGDIFVRSYGLFPHPNVLGGFLALSLIITLVYHLLFSIKLFHVEHSNQKEQIVPRGTLFSTMFNWLNKCSTWNILTKKSKLFHVEQLRTVWIYRVVFAVQLLALFLSFSKLAILSFILGFIVVILGIRKLFHVEQLDQKQKNVPRGTLRQKISGHSVKCSTWNILHERAIERVKKMFHVEHLVIVSGVVLLGILLFSLNLKLFFIQPLVERLFYIESIGAFYKDYFFSGLGIGQYVFTMQQFFDEKILLWQFQPIHNVFLLIFSEVGIIGFGLFLWFFVYLFFKNIQNVPRGTLRQQLSDHYSKCSTWNIKAAIIRPLFKMFHVEQSLDPIEKRDSESQKKVIETKNVPRGTILSSLCQSLLIIVGFIMLFDHYFWDIQQGQFLLWIVFALTASSKRY